MREVWEYVILYLSEIPETIGLFWEIILEMVFLDGGGDRDLKLFVCFSFVL